MTIYLPETAEIECDECGETDEVNLIPYPASHNGAEMVGYDPYDEPLPDEWNTNPDDDTEHFCPICSRKKGITK